MYLRHGQGARLGSLYGNFGFGEALTNIFGAFGAPVGGEVERPQIVGSEIKGDRITYYWSDGTSSSTFLNDPAYLQTIEHQEVPPVELGLEYEVDPEVTTAGAPQLGNKTLLALGAVALLFALSPKTWGR